MSKVNITKIVEGVGACSENLIGISEELISISEKVSAVANVIAEIISEFQTDKPAVEGKGKKTAAKQIEEKKKTVTDQKMEPVKEYTFTEVRTILAEKSRAGHTAEIKQILIKHGADKLSSVDAAEYAAIVAEAEVLE